MPSTSKLSTWLERASRLQEIYRSPFERSLFLKMLAEFLKAAGAPIVVILVQSLLPVVVLTMIVIGVAVVVEHRVERKALAARGTTAAMS
jgi:hypothetical protein